MEATGGEMCKSTRHRRCIQAPLPLQVGVGVLGGVEGAVHATRRFVEAMQKDTVLVKLDFSNAFNTLCRDIMLQAVARYIPELYAFAYANYSQATQGLSERSIILLSITKSITRTGCIPPCRIPR